MLEAKQIKDEELIEDLQGLGLDQNDERYWGDTDEEMSDQDDIECEESGDILAGMLGGIAGEGDNYEAAVGAANFRYK